MASTHKSLRSGTANKRPTTSIADGQIALNTNTTSPGLFFKDSTGATIIKVGPVHVGTTAPNASPAAGGSSGNSTGEVWLDTSLTPNGVKIWNGASWTNATPIGSTTVQGLLELATNAETQTGTDPDRAVTPAGLQSKVSDSTSTTSSTTIASSTAVKSAYDLANAALPKSGGTVTGNLEIGTTGSLSFEGATADAFETTIAVVDPTADRTITLPDTTGTVVTTGDTGTVTSTMIADGTIVNGDINASAAIDHSKLANITAGSVLLGNASNVPTATALSGDVTVNSTGVTAISSGVIVNADVNASAAIAGTKISPDFGSQTVQTTGIFSHALGTAAAPTVTFTGDTNTGIYSPGADQVAISTGGSGRLFVDASGNVSVGNSSAFDTAAGRGNISINGSSTALLALGTGGAQKFAIYHDGTNCEVNNLQAGYLDLKTQNQSRLRITSAGLVGIGTSSPGSVLDCRGDFRSSNADSDRLIVYQAPRGSAPGFASGANGSAGIFTVGAGVAVPLAIGTFANTPLTLATDNTPRLTVTGAGNVGIGTTSAATRLHLSGTQGDNSTLYITSTDLAANNGGIISIGGAYDGSGNTTAFAQIKALKDNATVGDYGGSLAFFNRVGAGGLNERARIDSSGRLLVGTSSSPSLTDGQYAKLHVIGNSNSATGNGFINVGRGQAASGALGVGTSLGVIQFTDNAGAVHAAIAGDTDATTGTNDYPGRLVFSVTRDGQASPTSRLWLVNSGYTYLQSEGQVFASATTQSAGTTYEVFVGGYGAAGGTYNSLNTSIKIWSNGNIQNTNNSYTAISDIKLKENVVNANSQWNDIKALQVRNYNLKEGQTHKQIGLIAQEVEPISPGLVYESPDRDEDGNDLGTVTKSVNYSVLYMKAVKALQEAMERIETLEAKVAALESA